MVGDSGGWRFGEVAIRGGGVDEPMLAAKIWKRLGSFVLDVDVRCSERVTGLFGVSGCGKTTFLNCLAGVGTADGGRIRLGSATWLDVERGVNLPARERRVGYVFQESLLFGHMTVLKNVTYGLEKHSSGPGLDEVVGVLEIGDLLGRMPDELSGGQQRRVAVARALLRHPALLLLDEPLTGLEAELAGRVLVYLKRVLDVFGIPTVYVSHSISDIAYLCDDAVVLSGGTVISQGPPGVVMTRCGVLDERHLIELQNVFEAGLVSTGGEDQSIRCRVGENELTVYGSAPRGGERLTLGIQACDIVLATQRPQGLSARNVLPGTVRRVEPVGSKVLVFLDVGVEWMVEVGRAAVAELGLRAEVKVFAIVKATAVRILG